MKYALLIYDTDDAWADRTDEERAALMGEYMAVSQADGVYGGAQLQPPLTATTVRVDGDETVLTDGPFIDAKEFFGGGFLIEADDLDVATALASRIPAARLGGAVEVRPIVERPGS
jgi:hypothetical protein